MVIFPRRGGGGPYIYLTADINLGATDDGTFDPIGKYISSSDTSAQFKATFDGQGHMITLTLNRPNDNYVGLFGYVGAKGLVCNLGVGGNIVGKDEVGGVVGYGGSDCMVSNCYNTGNITGGANTGGVSGRHVGSVISNCYNMGNVCGDTYVAGIVGGGGGGKNINNCYNSGSISSYGTGAWIYTGGILGYGSSCGLKACYNVECIEADEASNCVGGILGYGSNCTITSCYYLTGTASKGQGNGNDGTKMAKKTAAEMKDTGFVDLLNQTSNGLNPFAFNASGYPTLKKECSKVVSGGAKVSIGGYGGRFMTMRGYVDASGKADKWEIIGKTNPQFFAKPGYKLDYISRNGRRINLNTETGWKVTKTGAIYSGTEEGDYTVIFKRDE